MSHKQTRTELTFEAHGHMVGVHIKDRRRLAGAHREVLNNTTHTHASTPR